MDIRTLWQAVLNDLEIQVSKAVFKTLLSQTSLLSFKDETAIIGCNNPLLINLVEKKYTQLIKSTLDQYTKIDTKLIFEAYSKSEKRAVDGPLFTLKYPASSTASATNIRLNPDYTFENFAVSSSNQMAYAAATAVAAAPGVSYNPLFLYGGTGVGKTHLAQAIAHYVLKAKPDTKLIYCTGEEFTNEIIEAIGSKTTVFFKKKYRNLDIFLVDDIQFIAGKNAVQEEFFHTFNSIHQYRGQIVIISDKLPEEINKLEDRLRSRFEGGLTIDIGQPDFELRCAILIIKAKQRGVELPIELVKLLAANIENPRKLEGILVRIITESQTRQIPIDHDLVKAILGKTIKEIPSKNSIKPTEVVEKVASYYNLKLSQLKGIKRDKFLSLPRQIIYYLLNVEVGLSLVEIGEILGGRDHTTILHGVRKVTNLLSTDEKIRGDILGIKTELFG